MTTTTEGTNSSNQVVTTDNNQAGTTTMANNNNINTNEGLSNTEIVQGLLDHLSEKDPMLFNCLPEWLQSNRKIAISTIRGIGRCLVTFNGKKLKLRLDDNNKDDNGGSGDNSRSDRDSHNRVDQDYYMNLPSQGDALS